MCGIAGTFQIDLSRPANDGRVPAALRALAHRGPDDEGVYTNGRAFLGHRRLSIIDASPAGHQPFTDNGGRYTIAYNGEVFNFQELRAELEAQGHAFRSQSDTEVILRLYTIKGEGFLRDLNGFFALAIHDAETDTLLVARDRYGIKPLVWCEHGGAFLFASELRALQAMGAPGTVDPGSVAQYLSYHYIAGPHTILEDVRKLEPGRLIRVSASGTEVHVWYDLVKAAAPVAPGTDVEARLHSLLDDAVQQRLVADVPVGCFLSGGLDSSIISALAARHHKDLHTFSIGFVDDPYFDESRHAQEVADHIGSTHHTFRLTRTELADSYERFLSSLDEPFADSSALLSFLLCERARPFITVALSGDGADEVFGGYRKHQAELRLRSKTALERVVIALGPLWRTLPRSRNGRLSDLFRKMERFARAGGLPPAERWAMLAALDGDGDARDLLPGHEVPVDRIRHMARGLTEMAGLNGVLLADVRTVLPYDMLHKVDGTSMAQGLEVRPPFLDHRVVEFAFGLDASEKLGRGKGKHLLCRTFRERIPAPVLRRRKQGFEAPLRALFTGPLKATVRRALSPDRVAAAGLDMGAVRGILARMESPRPGQSPDTVHAMIVLLNWLCRTGHALGR